MACCGLMKRNKVHAAHAETSLPRSKAYQASRGGAVSVAAGAIFPTFPSQQIDTLRATERGWGRLVTEAAKPRKTRARAPSDGANRPASDYAVLATQISAAFQTLIRWGFGLFMVRYGYLAIDSLAGKTTLANIVLNLLSNVSFSSSVAWGGTAVAAIYGYRQKRLRENTVQRLSSRIEELEQGVDPDRTSSQLTSKGRTNPKDKR
jgi:hypothetical protein